MRRAHPAWGPDRIVWQLGRDGVDPLPGRSSVYRALVRHGLVEAKRRDGVGRTAGGGSGRGRWSCGRWT
jgi:hypothetical protein